MDLIKEFENNLSILVHCVNACMAHICSYGSPMYSSVRLKCFAEIAKRKKKGKFLFNFYTFMRKKCNKLFLFFWQILQKLNEL